jgi:hypothetical protein
MRLAQPVVGLVAIAAVGAVALPSQAASTVKPKVRTVTISYSGGCGVGVNVEDNGFTATPGLCATGQTYDIAKKGKEKYLSIAVTDQSGRATSGSVWLNTSAAQAFCGSLKNYRMGQSTYTLDLNVAADTSCPGLPTSGKVVIKYSNVPIK